MDNMKWLWKFAKRYRWRLGFNLALTLIIIVCAFIEPMMIGRFVDDVIVNGKEGLVFYSLLIICSVIIKNTLTYFRKLIYEDVSQEIIKSIRGNIFSKLQSLDLGFYRRNRTGEIMNRLTMDTDAVRHFAAWTVPTLIEYLFYVVVGFVVLFIQSPVVTLCLFGISPFIAVTAYLLSKNCKVAFLNIVDENSKLNTVVQENIEGNRVIKAYAKEDYEIEKFEKRNMGYQNAFMRYVDVWRKYGPLLDMFRNFLTVIFILAGGLFVISGSITIGQFAAINGCLWCISIPMAGLGGLITEYQQFNASVEKIRKLESTETSIKNLNIKKRDTGINGKIEFKNVTFAFGGDRVLKNLNFSCEAGSTIGIIGPTGSGKSTIVNLISRFYDPTYGTVYIDGINLKNYDIKTLRYNVASAMQDVFLFSDTIFNNIAFGSPNATIDDVIRVAKEADAHNFITKLPDGYQTIVGEKGTGLSGGQRQRISLARALLKNPAILILDDVTSALDMETEFSIQRKINENKKTKVIIAHRISSVKNADLILVLNQGNLIEWGNHEELMAQNGYYKGVFEHQFGEFNHGPKYHIQHPAYQQSIFNGGEINGSK